MMSEIELQACGTGAEQHTGIGDVAKRQDKLVAAAGSLDRPKRLVDDIGSNYSQRLRSGCQRSSAYRTPKGVVGVIRKKEIAATLKRGISEHEKIGTGAGAKHRNRAAQSSTTPVVGILMSTSQTVASAWIQAFQDGLQELGYIAPRDVEIAVRYSEGDNARLPGLAEELVHLEPKVILATSVLSTRAVLQATAATPIVNPLLVEPVLFGFAANDARPGGQVSAYLIVIETPSPRL